MPVPPTFGLLKPFLEEKGLMYSYVTRTFFILLCTFGLSILVGADTIKLKNGSIIRGKVTSYNDREFTVSLDTGVSGKRTSSRLVLSIEDVDSIQFDGETDGAYIPSIDSPERPQVNRPVNSNSAAKATDMRDSSTSKSTTPTFTNTPPPAQPSGPAEIALGEKTVSVIAAADWTSTELRIKKGQRVTINASGQIDLGSNHRSGPEGTTLNDPKKLILNSPTGALIAVVGDDNDDFIVIGASGSFVADRDGILFLSVNETNLKDNLGSFTARIKVFGK